MPITREVFQDILVGLSHVIVFISLEMMIGQYIGKFGWALVILGALVMYFGAKKIEVDILKKSLVLMGSVIIFLGLKPYVAQYINGQVWIFLLIGLGIFLASNSLADLVS